MAKPAEPNAAVSTLYLCGAGNGEGIRLALQVNRATRRWQRLVLLDDDPSKLGVERLGLPVLGGFSRLNEANPSTDEAVNLVTRTTTGRANAGMKIASYGVAFASLIHPGVDLLGSQLEDGVTIYGNASIGAEAVVGRSSAVLIGAIVGHSARVGRGCVIAPNAVINARVVVEDHVYVGSNASILPELHIGAGATIAANSMVLSDVPAGATALGVPATIVQTPSGPSGRGMAPAERPRPPNDNELRAEAADSNAPMPLNRAQLESAVTNAMRHVLSLDVVPPSANFFDLGGASLKAVRVCEHLNAQAGLPAQPLDLFRFPSVVTLSMHLAGLLSRDAAVSQAKARGAQRRSLLHVTRQTR